MRKDALPHRQHYCTEQSSAVCKEASQGQRLLLSGMCNLACKVTVSLEADLIVAQPHPVVCHAEADHVIMEGLALGVTLWGGEDVREHLLQQLQVGLLIKCLHTHQRCLNDPCCLP